MWPPFPRFRAATQAKTLDTLMKGVREVVELCIEDGGGVPSMELVGVQQISV